MHCRVFSLRNEIDDTHKVLHLEVLHAKLQYRFVVYMCPVIRRQGNVLISQMFCFSFLKFVVNGVKNLFELAALPGGLYPECETSIISFELFQLCCSIWCTRCVEKMGTGFIALMFLPRFRLNDDDGKINEPLLCFCFRWWLQSQVLVNLLKVFLRALNESGRLPLFQGF